MIRLISDALAAALCPAALAQVTLTVTSTFKNGVTSFTGQDTIRAIRSGGKKK